MSKYKFLILFFCLIATYSYAQNVREYEYMFRLMLKDKGDSGFDVAHPEQFLSKRSLDRRLRQQIIVDETDLPISQTYIQQVESLGCKVIAKSKWLGSVVVFCKDSTLVDELKMISFVDDVHFVWRGLTEAPIKAKVSDKKALGSVVSSYYGHAAKQIEINNGTYLHDKGYRGEGMSIAVIDAGYRNFDDILLLGTVSLGGFKDFVYNGGDMFKSSDHGLAVLSCMATNAPDFYVGTAPKATYWLLRSEDSRSEFPVEQDYWVAAAEYADSVGVDLINTSLGYAPFDFPAQSITYDQLDGKTVFMTKGLDLATQKGIFVVVSAGNEGAKDWRKLTAPGDAIYGLTVGSVRNDLTISSFSSRGPTADLRIKPDVMAMGEQTAVLNDRGEVVLANGTSFSTPVMCGMIACLWQAYPSMKNRELLQLVRSSSDRYQSPNENYGYGIPDMKKAFDMAANITSISDAGIYESSNFDIFSDTLGLLRIVKHVPRVDCIAYVYTLEGVLVAQSKILDHETAIQLSATHKQLYVVTVVGKDLIETRKLYF